MSKMTSSKTLLTPDFCVIGGGSGGLSFAAGASQMGASVILVEHKKMGGDCLNSGCVPSKSLIAAAKSFHSNKEASHFGWKSTKPSVDFEKVHAHIQEVINSIAPNDSIERFQNLGVHVITEHGAFFDQNTLETANYRIKAKRFIIATGSSPFIPPISGLSDVSYLSNETIFDLKEQPQHLIVVGGGPIGIELAQSFHRLGSKVTVLEAFAALPKDDPQMTSTLKKHLIREGIDLKEFVKISNIKQHNGIINCTYHTADGEEKEVSASHIIIATGRRANIGKLNLEAAHIDFSPRGITVDAYLRTTNKRVYAMGDCAVGPLGSYQFTHVANYHAGIAIRNSIFRLHSKVATHALPWVTYTDPELAQVGALESQLIQNHTPHKILRMDFKENDRAHAEKRTEGCIKVLVSPKGYVLGVTILGLHAGELIQPWVMMIQNKLKISAMTNTIAPYPTLSDINKRVAGLYYKEVLFGPRMRKIVKFLMSLIR